MSTQVGRPRNPDVEIAVQTAVRQLLAEGGYDAVSFQKVALRAGVGQPTVYRRWATKHELVEAAVFSLIGWSDPPLSGNLVEDLASVGTEILNGLADPVVRSAVPGLLAAYTTAPDGHARLRAWAESPLRTAFVRAVAEALPAVDPTSVRVHDVFDMYLSSLVFLTLTRGDLEVRQRVNDFAAVAANALTGLVT